MKGAYATPQKKERKTPLLAPHFENNKPYLHAATALNI